MMKIEKTAALNQIFFTIPDRCQWCNKIFVSSLNLKREIINTNWLRYFTNCKIFLGNNTSIARTPCHHSLGNPYVIQSLTSLQEM